MEDSTHEQVVDQPTTESKISRRDMAKLLGTVTALSASLGVSFVTSAATVPEGGQLKLKFLKQGQLLCTIDISPEDQRKLASTEGPVELRMVQLVVKIENPPKGRGTPQEVTVSSWTISKTVWHTLKL
jgi:hypothetical protein